MTIPHVGHSVTGNADCAEAAVRRFMSDRPVGTPCLREKAFAFSTGPIPTSIDQLRASGNEGGSVGRTISAVRLTIVDAATTAEMFYDFPRFPGLRRGFGTLGGSGAVHLRRYSYVPGVEITGSLTGRTASLKISGSKAAAGKLVQRKGHKFVGRLGGKRVSFSG